MSAIDPRRRSALLAALGAACGPRLAWAANAAALDDRRFVLVILRGGLDGLTAVPALGDPAFAAARGALALSLQGESAALPLNATFGLHPVLRHMHALYQRRELLVVHAVATPYRDRSHFDAQNLLETGGRVPFEEKSGWLNRALHEVAPNRVDAATALGTRLPLVLQGPARVANYSPEHRRRGDADLLTRLARMYEPNPELSAALLRALGSLETAARAAPVAGEGGSGSGLVAAARAAARLLSLDAGPRVAVLEADGYDSHATQAAMAGIPARQLRELDAALLALQQDLGAIWRTTLVAIVTEFGRTVAPNGSGGTDHGTGAAMFLVGGAVLGGRVIADWPGLRANDLYERRDLQPTTDLFAVLASALATHWGRDFYRLQPVIAPGRTLKPLDGLVRRATLSSL